MLRTTSPKHFLVAMILALNAHAQPTAQASTAQPSVVGNWLGTLDTGIAKLRLVFHVTANDRGDLSGTLDSLDQNLKGAAVREFSVSGPAVHLNISGLRASFDGTLSPDGNILAGTFTQGAAVPLELRRVDTVDLLPRPQQPQSPFPYRSGDVSYQSGGSRLAGTLTTPAGDGPFPAVILISGLGEQDRDGTLAAHKPFWVIADYLTRRGIAVLRVDDRGVGKSEGTSSELTLEDLAGDVVAGLVFLKTQPQLDASRLGLVGHSEGGIVAPLVAIRSSDVAFLVTLAGIGVPGDEALSAQAETLARAAGAPEETIQQNREIQAAVFKVLRAERDPNAATLRLTSEIQTMKTNLSSASLEALLRRRYAAVSAPQIRSVVLANPAELFRQVKVPVLAMNGSRDAQVPAALNLPGVAVALAAGGNTDFAVAVLPGLNHLFQTCRSCQPAEYGQLEETFSPAALTMMGDWIVRHTLRR